MFQEGCIPRWYSSVGLRMMEAKASLLMSFLCPLSEESNKNDRENLGVVGVIILKGIIIKYLGVSFEMPEET